MLARTKKVSFAETFSCRQLGLPATFSGIRYVAVGPTAMGSAMGIPCVAFAIGMVMLSSLNSTTVIVTLTVFGMLKHIVMSVNFHGSAGGTIAITEVPAQYPVDGQPFHPSGGGTGVYSSSCVTFRMAVVFVVLHNCWPETVKAKDRIKMMMTNSIVFFRKLLEIPKKT